MKNISLVTGGAGFIGSHIVNHLIAQDVQVVVLDDLSGGYNENVNARAIFKLGSITDSSLVDNLFAEYKFDYVYHLAAYAAEGLSHFIRRFNYENNLLGSINLINAAVNYGVKCFVFTSSIAVYGTNNLPFIENLHPRPEDPYGIAKYAVEMDLLNAHKMFGLDYIIFRPHNVYGVNQNIGDRYRNVVGIFMNQILQGKPLTIYGDGKQTRAFSHISSVAPFIADSTDITQAYNQTFNIGGDRVYSILYLAEAVNKAMGATKELIHLPPRFEVTHIYADQTKFEAVFIPQEKLTLEDGLAEMAGWVKANGVRSSKKFDKLEIKRNLPDPWK